MIGRQMEHYGFDLCIATNGSYTALESRVDTKSILTRDDEICLCAWGLDLKTDSLQQTKPSTYSFVQGALDLTL
jgi:hypothetical protein